MSTTYKTPVSKAKKKAPPPPAQPNVSINLMLSPPLAESTKISTSTAEASLCETSLVSNAANLSENKKSNSAKPKRVRRNYDKFKVGHEIDKKEGWVDEQGRLITVKDKIDALFKPQSTNCEKKSPPPPQEPSTSSSSDEANAQELPPDPRYPVLLQSSITTRDIYDCQRLVTRLNFIKEDMDKMAKETSPRIEQKIKDIGERKKEIMEMAKERLERIDRDIIEKHKFPSGSDISIVRTDVTKRNSFVTRPSFGDFVTESRKRPAENEQAEKEHTEVTKKPAATIKRRRTIGNLGASLSNVESYRSRGVIVTTSLHEDEQAFVKEAVGKLGGFTIQDEVSRTTTHLICGLGRRTMNVLRAICRGCWVVTTEWVSASLDAGHWLPEEEFETIAYFPNCRATRISRLEAEKPTTSDVAGGGSRRGQKNKNDEDSSLSLSCVLPILLGCGGIYVSPDLIKPKQHDVHQLIRLCSGRVARTPNEARIVIANRLADANLASSSSSTSTPPIVISPNWLLDSIMATSVLSTDTYVLQNSRRSSNQ